MEYSIYLNQLRCIDWKLTYPEAILCSYFSNEHNWVRTRIIDQNGDYLCIAISKLIKDLPIIGTSKSFFSKTLNSLVEKGLFEKIVDEYNSKAVFYRFLPAAKVWWKYPEVSLATDIKKRSLLVTNVFKDLQVLLNDNTIIKCEQLFSNENEVFPNENKLFSNENEVFPNENLSYNYNHITNQNTNNHNIENDDDSFKSQNNTKENIAKKEFEKIIELYPYTVNNTQKAIALAFGSFSNLTAAQRVDLQKAVKNYSKTKQVKDHISKNTTNFIQNLNTFITKSYTQFIYGLPENYSFEEEFETIKKPNGATFADVTVFNGIDEQSESLKPYIEKFEQVKAILESDSSFDVKDCEKYDDAKIKAIFTPKEYEVFCDQMGWVEFAHKYDVIQLADSMNDCMKESK